MTSHRETAILFIGRFCAGDVTGLEPLLCEELQFRGPLHEFDSREAYLSVLCADPPERCDFQLLSVTQAEECVAVFYEYQKPDGSLTIAQLFRFRDARISEITLVFDGRSFELPVSAD